MKGITFEAGDKTHVLRFDINALCVLEDETGKGVDQIGGLLAPQGGASPRVKDLRLLFWAGLGGGQKEGITREQAGVVMSELGYHEAGALMMRAFVDAFPQIADAVTEAKDDGGNVEGAAAA